MRKNLPNFLCCCLLACSGLLAGADDVFKDVPRLAAPTAQIQVGAQNQPVPPGTTTVIGNIEDLKDPKMREMVKEYILKKGIEPNPDVARALGISTNQTQRTPRKSVTVDGEVFKDLPQQAGDARTERVVNQAPETVRLMDEMRLFTQDHEAFGKVQKAMYVANQLPEVKAHIQAAEEIVRSYIRQNYPDIATNYAHFINIHQRLQGQTNINFIK